jgi:hypothetical protein
MLGGAVLVLCGAVLLVEVAGAVEPVIQRPTAARAATEKDNTKTTQPRYRACFPPGPCAMP